MLALKSGSRTDRLRALGLPRKEIAHTARVPLTTAQAYPTHSAAALSAVKQLSNRMMRTSVFLVDFSM